MPSRDSVETVPDFHDSHRVEQAKAAPDTLIDTGLGSSTSTDRPAPTDHQQHPCIETPPDQSEAVSHTNDPIMISYRTWIHGTSTRLLHVHIFLRSVSSSCDFNPIQSNAIQSNAIQSNPVGLNRFSGQRHERGAGQARSAMIAHEAPPGDASPSPRAGLDNRDSRTTNRLVLLDGVYSGSTQAFTLGARGPPRVSDSRERER